MFGHIGELDGVVWSLQLRGTVEAWVNVQSCDIIASEICEWGTRADYELVEVSIYGTTVSSGAIAAGSLKRALFIFGVTGYAVMSSAGNSGKTVMPVGVAGNHSFS